MPGWGPGGRPGDNAALGAEGAKEVMSKSGPSMKSRSPGIAFVLLTYAEELQCFLREMTGQSYFYFGFGLYLCTKSLF